MSKFSDPMRVSSGWPLSGILWSLLWAVLLVSALVSRPILPVDETRYISVAWEMWLRDNFLVPHLNGATYSHKPPLLFWLINAGWGIFGLNDITPRIVAPLFGLGSLVMTSLLSRRLWPESSAYSLAPFLLLGCFYWGLYTTLTMFDLILAFWTLVGLYGLTGVWRGLAWRGWILFGCAVGVGVLSKGPVILVYLLPSALLAPYWAIGGRRPSWVKWYGGLIGGTILGAGLALAWVLPAGEAGGEAYKNAILWGQSAGRMVKSFAHQKPFWWYLSILPGLLLPWLIWPSFLKNICCVVVDWRLSRKENLSRKADAGLRLILVWALAALVIFSVISGKRPHYLLPMFPALALGGAMLLTKLSADQWVRGRWDLAPFAGITILFGAAILLSPLIAAGIGKLEYVQGVSLMWSLPLFAVGILFLIRPPAGGFSRILSISAASTLVVITVHGIAQPRLELAYNLQPLANHLAAAQGEGYVIANKDKYHGQYNFLGRLKNPVVFTDSKLLPSWLKKNPKSKVVSYHYQSPAKFNPEFFQEFRGRFIAVWDGEMLSGNPAMANRKYD
ncbi:MAG: hypothetical protein CMM74_00690 [Rhodospirillaceae bacterium]|nr:hypothetical protein [Rhodospirillaceae bacterium]